MSRVTRKRVYPVQSEDLPSTSSKTTKTSTRTTSGAFLIGHPARSIAGSKLPTLRQVMQVLLHEKASGFSSGGMASNRDCITFVVDRVNVFWQMAGIKTITKPNSILRLESDFAEWTNLKKSMGRPTDPGNKREKFTEKLDKLWDIGAPDAVKEIQTNRLLTPGDKQQDIAFYFDQQNERNATMSGNDKILKKKVEEKQLRQQAPFVTTATESQTAAIYEGLFVEHMNEFYKRKKACRTETLSVVKLKVKLYIYLQHHFRLKHHL